MPKKSANELDDQLAEFTDRTLSGQPLDATYANTELRFLDETVNRLKAISGSVGQRQEVATRVEKALRAEWMKNGYGAVKAPEGSLGSLLRKLFWQANPQRRLAFGALLVFLIIALPLGFIFTGELQASAGMVFGQYRVVLLIIAVVLVLGLLWLGRDKS